jgi:hypothetical protein
MLPSFATQSITVRRAALVDDHGTDVRDWSGSLAEHTIAGCSVQPLTAQEILANRDAVQVQWRVYAPAGADVEATDHVAFGGHEYEVVGEPLRWPSPTGGLDHVELLLSRWEG